jgi:thioesterase domain-containing protein
MENILSIHGLKTWQLTTFKQIQTLQPNGPYYLGGYSFGGVVAFEMARQLQEQGEQVGILVVLDSCRPGYSWRASFLKRVSCI